MDTTLVIMAAGLGSRYSKNEIKQLADVGPNGEIIMDYSIHDALEAGFNKIVFVIRKDIEAAFHRVIGHRIEKIAKCEYVFQELDMLPDGYDVIEGRTKPLGTGHAILCVKDAVHEPFAIINADDYYGKKAFKNMHDFLVANANGNGNYCMSGFILKNTLSDNGGVTRGICKVEDGKLVDVEETKNIIKCETGARVQDGKQLDLESYVSMNMWGVTPDFLDVLEDNFVQFLDSMKNPLTDEFLLPTIIDTLIKSGKCNVSVLPTDDSWFGVTYESDKAIVQESFKQLIEQGVYKTPLF